MSDCVELDAMKAFSYERCTYRSEECVLCFVGNVADDEMTQYYR